MRSACGSITRQNAAAGVKPSASAAAPWPAGTLASPALQLTRIEGAGIEPDADHAGKRFQRRRGQVQAAQVDTLPAIKNADRVLAEQLRRTEIPEEQLHQQRRAAQEANRAARGGAQRRQRATCERQPECGKHAAEHEHRERQRYRQAEASGDPADVPGGQRLQQDGVHPHG
ncbi:hypothetical protein ACU4HD_35230 [Cupriavidus basilensis]